MQEVLIECYLFHELCGKKVYLVLSLLRDNLFAFISEAASLRMTQCWPWGSQVAVTKIAILRKLFQKNIILNIN